MSITSKTSPRATLGSLTSNTKSQCSSKIGKPWRLLPIYSYVPASVLILFFVSTASPSSLPLITGSRSGRGEACPIAGLYTPGSGNVTWSNQSSTKRQQTSTKLPRWRESTASRLTWTTGAWSKKGTTTAAQQEAPHCWCCTKCTLTTQLRMSNRWVQATQFRKFRGNCRGSTASLRSKKRWQLCPCFGSWQFGRVVFPVTFWPRQLHPLFQNFFLRSYRSLRYCFWRASILLPLPLTLLLFASIFSLCYRSLHQCFAAPVLQLYLPFTFLLFYLASFLI